MTENALIPMTALDRLKKTAERSNLDEFVTARTRRSILLVDCSSSMADTIASGERRIDALRKRVDLLRTTHPVPMVSFPTIELVERVPEPHGMTPLSKAIDFATMQEANHIVVITDGCPDSQQAAFDAAARFKGPIDVFFIGESHEAGAKFCAELARRTGGQCGLTDLAGSPKELAGKIQLLLGDGSGL
jgi:Mg-chelatase subunit ChlD